MSRPRPRLSGGILIYGNGAGGDATGRATAPELVAYAKSIGFAVVATGYWGLFGWPDGSELPLFEGMLRQFAELSDHPEMVDAPWLPMGHSTCWPVIPRSLRSSRSRGGSRLSPAS
jgi:hypothetical protein